MPDNNATAIVIFGASGDLTRRKLIPALYELTRQELLPENTVIVGFARREKTHDEFRKDMHEGIKQFARVKPKGNDKALDAFLKNLYYHTGSYDDKESFVGLKDFLAELDEELGTSAGNRLYYLSTPPNLFATIACELGESGQIANPHDDGHWTRIIIEKPFGRDLASARALNRDLLSALAERQIFRIDHYLGKETVQNIMAFRFGNSIFEPLWNRRYVDHVQITVSEAVSVGSRAGYYDTSGAIRDMVQNHILQLVALVAMEPPASFAANAVRNEKVKVLNSLRPVTPEDIGHMTIRGQYSAGKIGDKSIPDYHDEPDVATDSKTETYVALKFYLDNWRWAGIPFYARTGKALNKRISEITIQFRQPPLALFGHAQHEGHVDGDEIAPNTLTMRVQPNEGIRLRFGLKIPGPKMLLQPNEMEFYYQEVFDADPPEAYERLILDAILGDSTLFIRHDEVEAAWTYVDTILDAWQDKSIPIHKYEPGSWGPKAAEDFMVRDGRKWVRL